VWDQLGQSDEKFLFLCPNRITVLRDGKKVDTMNTQDVNTQDIVRMMVGQEIAKHAPPASTSGERREAIRVEHLTRRETVSYISFTAYKGEILGITGVIGAGKSELARVIFGADKLDAGQLFLYGEACAIHSPQGSGALHNGSHGQQTQFSSDKQKELS
jgi:ribose transport system ATP-binding protein